MNTPIKVLITGVDGFIGSALQRVLMDRGCEVWGISASRSDGRILRADLRNAAETRRVLSTTSNFDAVIHCAAIAHSENKYSIKSCYEMNPIMTNNLLQAIEGQCKKFIFMSSIAVYGEADRDCPVGVSTESRPSTNYGFSKLASEKIVLSSRCPEIAILRLAPVYDEEHLRDIKKRVFFPCQSVLKMKLMPTPQYSLCHINNLTGRVWNLLSHNFHPPKTVMNIADPTPYSQHVLNSWFKGINILLPIKAFWFLYYFSYYIPFKYGYSIRCIMWKLFRSNVYE